MDAPRLTYTGDTIAQRDGAADVRAWFRRHAQRAGLRLIDQVAGLTVLGRVEPGQVRIAGELVTVDRLLADCECGGAEYVSRAQPVFFCLSCGNATNGGRWRTVLFAEDLEPLPAEES